MHILLHVCCGPCTVYPLEQLRQDGHTVTGYFFNPNIHPYREFKRRIAALRQFAELTDFNVEIDTRYGLSEFLRQVVFKEQARCSICYDMRLSHVAMKAAEHQADAFTTTLLYSKYQQHSLLKKKGKEYADANNTSFYYQDFREGWQQGIEQSIAMDLYRQPYCGCIYSEQERYDKKLRKSNHSALSK
ncbi:epoxyqueuosine reductase QueH [Desulfogranum japonicum]|uniref:epoxyqueuosine reductase QueH n=1 Tax=Desulfogranum japonicum TaxID=231447 RepID=UPI000421FDAA|nr:epoxyqueuosine reductase QueH [Desulfogranum japonicum]